MSGNNDLSEQMVPLAKLQGQADVWHLLNVQQGSTDRLIHRNCTQLLEWFKSYKEIYINYLQDFPYAVDISEMKVFNPVTKMLSEEVVTWLNTETPHRYVWFKEHLFFALEPDRILFKLSF